MHCLVVTTRKRLQFCKMNNIQSCIVHTLTKQTNNKQDVCIQEKNKWPSIHIATIPSFGAGHPILTCIVIMSRCRCQHVCTCCKWVQHTSISKPTSYWTELDSLLSLTKISSKVSNWLELDCTLTDLLQSGQDWKNIALVIQKEIIPSINRID